MGLIGATFKIVSYANDKVPFTPRTRDIYEKACRLDLFNVLPEYPAESEQDIESDLENISKTLVNGDSLQDGGSSDKISKIKEKLILSRRVKIAVNEGDKDFNYDNIMKHNNDTEYLLPPYKSGRSTGYSKQDISDYNYGSSDEETEYDKTTVEEVEVALGYLSKAFTNDRVKNDNDLFARFFNNSMTLIINSVFKNRKDFKFDKIITSLDKHLKFYILQTYLNDDQLIYEFKSNFQQSQPVLSPPSPVTKPISKTRRNRKSDQLTLKTIQLIIALTFKFFKFFISVVLPLIQLIWFSFLELNDQYQMINRINDLTISFFTLFIDQIFLFIDNGESFEDPVLTPRSSSRNNTYYNMLKSVVTNKLSTYQKNSDKYEFEASSTPF